MTARRIAMAAKVVAILLCFVFMAVAVAHHDFAKGTFFLLCTHLWDRWLKEDLEESA